ncbi:anti-phage dCTP deaminase [Methylovulum psychrotolerans]|uniref:Cytidine deaminase n=1 Tax=Methylovulum psychrotolerans TaxID=1704499 RepID=A0A1Z4BUM9_9GAMM|nr:anti-phage dCTP deaminase [Methylovulum psychrotolerans]ASF45007.1 cytidine deaminase [Methylovulum psychrotolerans]
MSLYGKSELVIGLVTAVGANSKPIIDLLTTRLKHFKYNSKEIKISQEVISYLSDQEIDNQNQYNRISQLMDYGNEIRKKYQDKGVLANGVAARIFENRPSSSSSNNEKEPLPRTAFIINSLKTPEEVHRLRYLYSSGFYLISIYSEETKRLKYLCEDLEIEEEKAIELIERDKSDKHEFGQQTRGTFHLADFFLHLDAPTNQIKYDTWRFLDLIFGHPNLTPTFDEYSMFMAFSSALRSADLSRQVGAVIAKNGDLIASGANDVPKFGGGLYWPERNKEGQLVDHENGRDYICGSDPNVNERKKLISDMSDKICQKLELSPEQKSVISEIISKTDIKAITEYGRAVHAEMEAILSCARRNVSTKNATLFSTTFPCHNCAKHIIAAGIERVVFVEPYPKSKAFDLHSDAICIGLLQEDNKVTFEPFVGVGPRSFFTLFSIDVGLAYPVKRKAEDGKAILFDKDNAKLRSQLLPVSYLDREIAAIAKLADSLKSNNLTVKKEFSELINPLSEHVKNWPQWKKNVLGTF